MPAEMGLEGLLDDIPLLEEAPMSKVVERVETIGLIAHPCAVKGFVHDNHHRELPP